MEDENKIDKESDKTDNISTSTNEEVETSDSIIENNNEESLDKDKLEEVIAEKVDCDKKEIIAEEAKNINNSDSLESEKQELINSEVVEETEEIVEIEEVEEVEEIGVNEEQEKESTEESIALKDGNKTISSDDNENSSSKPDSVIKELDKLRESSLNNSEEDKNKENETHDLKKEEVIAGGVIASETNEASNESDSSTVSKEETSNEGTLCSETVPVNESKNLFFIKLKSYFNFDFWKTFFFDSFFLLLCVLFIFVLVKKWFVSREVLINGTKQTHSSLESGEKTTIGNINILVMGIDSVEGTHRSDTIFVLGVNPSKKKITMLSIPRDTRVIIYDKGRKINEILPRYGVDTLKNILEDLLKVKISKKVEIGFESFISIVDAIGGVDINIEKAMNYDDNWGNLHIHFKPGMNHLNGEDALRYVRFRKDAMADLGRIKRQQDFVKAVIKKLLSPTTIIKVPSILEKAFKYIKTDFTLQEILTLAKGFDSFDVKVRSMSLPGEARYIDKISFFKPYSDEAIAIGNNYFSDLAVFELEKDYNSGKVIPKKSKTNRKNK